MRGQVRSCLLYTSFDARLAVQDESVPTYISDADLAVFHTEIEIEDREDE